MKKCIIIPEKEFLFLGCSAKDVNSLSVVDTKEIRVVLPEDSGFGNTKLIANFLSGIDGKECCKLDNSFLTALSFNGNKEVLPAELWQRPLFLDVLSQKKSPSYIELGDTEKKEALKKALKKNSGVVTAAGRDLGLPESSASYFVKKLGLVEYARKLKKAAKKSEKSA